MNTCSNCPEGYYLTLEKVYLKFNLKIIQNKNIFKNYFIQKKLIIFTNSFFFLKKKMEKKVIKKN
jgi:hypothetical protein